MKDFQIYLPHIGTQYSRMPIDLPLLWQANTYLPVLSSKVEKKWRLRKTVKESVILSLQIMLKKWSKVKRNQEDVKLIAVRPRKKIENEKVTHVAYEIQII